MKILSLSSELWLHIFGYLAPHEQSKAGLVCKDWYQFSHDSLLLRHTWRHYIGRDLPSEDRLCQELYARWSADRHLRSVFTEHAQLSMPKQASSQLAGWIREGRRHSFADGRSFTTVVRLVREGDDYRSLNLPRREALLIQQNAASDDPDGRLCSFPPQEPISVNIPHYPYLWPLHALKSFVSIPPGDNVRVLRAGSDFVIGWLPSTNFIFKGRSIQPIVIERASRRELLLSHGTSPHWGETVSGGETQLFDGWALDDEILILAGAFGSEIDPRRRRIIRHVRIFSLNQRCCIFSFELSHSYDSSIRDLRCLGGLVDGQLRFSYEVCTAGKSVQQDAALMYRDGEICLPDFSLEEREVSGFDRPSPFGRCEIVEGGIRYAAYLSAESFDPFAPEDMSSLTAAKKSLGSYHLTVGPCLTSSNDADLSCCWIKPGLQPYVVGVIEAGIAIWFVYLDREVQIEGPRLALHTPDPRNPEVCVEAVADRYLILDFLSQAATTTYLDLTAPVFHQTQENQVWPRDEQ